MLGWQARFVSSFFLHSQRFIINIFMNVRACHRLVSLRQGGAWAHTDSLRGGEEGPQILKGIIE